MDTKTTPAIVTLAEQVKRVALNEYELGIATWTAQYACEVTASALMNEYKNTGDNYLLLARELTAVANLLSAKLGE